MTDENRPGRRAKGVAPAARDPAREARRGAALRLNLRRRKAADAPIPEAATGEER